MMMFFSIRFFRIRVLRAVISLAVLPVLLLGALGSAEPVVYQPEQPTVSAPTAGSGGAYNPSGGMVSTTPNLTVAPGQLGVAVANLSGPDQLFYKRDTGAVIEQVVANSPAARAGLFRNDVILAIDDKPINVAADVSATLQGTTPGQTRKVRVLRDKKEQVIVVTF